MFSFKNMKFKTKLFLLVGVTVFGLLVFGFTSYAVLNKVRVGGPISAELQQNYELGLDIAPPRLNILETRSSVYRMLNDTDPELLRRDIERFHQLKLAYDDAHQSWEKRLPDGKMRELVLDKAHDPVVEYYRGVEQDLVPALLQGDKKKAESMVPGLKSKYEAHNSSMQEAVKLRNEELAGITKRVEETVRSSELSLLGMGVAVGIIASLLGFVISRGILRTLMATMQVLQGLAHGDLRQKVEVDSTDEIGTMGLALNQAIESMASTIQSIAATAEHVASASEEISSSAAQQAQSAETQKDQTTQVSTAMLPKPRARRRKPPVTAAPLWMKRSARCG